MNQKVWRCSNCVEHRKKYCNQSITIKEEDLQQSICKAISQAIECQDEIIEIMMSNLESVMTGKCKYRHLCYPTSNNRIK